MKKDISYFSFTLPLSKFRKNTYDENREYFTKATPSAIEATIMKIIPVAPKELLPFSKWVKWNDRDILNILENGQVILELISKDILTQESINHKFMSTEKLGIVKALMDEVTLNNSIKTGVVISLINGFTGDSQQPKYTILRKYGETGYS